MTLNHQMFTTLDELVAFINANAVEQARVQNVFCDTSGRFILLYWV